MPLRVVRLDEVPPATRNKKRRLETTEEWAQLRAKLMDGLRPYEAVYVTFDQDTLKKLGLKTAGRILLYMVKQFIRKANLQYDAWRYHSEGKEIVIVAARGATGQPQSYEEREEREERARAPRTALRTKK